MNSFSLDQYSSEQLRIARYWFFLAIFSLLTSGLFSILLVLSRTPAISEIIPWVDFFHTALVVHVDLSVLIWFLSFSAILWSLSNRKAAPRSDKLALLLAFAGTLIIIISPFSGQAHPLINNYIPVLNDRIFIFGLTLFGAGIAVMVLRSALHNDWSGFNSPPGVARFAILLSIITLIFTLAAQTASYLALPFGNNPQTYFEYLFWGSGHTLQFSHTLLVLLAWLWLGSASSTRYPFSARSYQVLFLLCFAPVLYVPFIYARFPVLSPEHLINFTELMRFGGLASLPLGLIVFIRLFHRPQLSETQKPLRLALISSILLFASGGILGFMIEGINVVIPAHYHGSIVGITLAFMGISYLLLPLFGYPAPQGAWVKAQPVIYASGQMMHIIGLAWSGGYGVQRKTAGAAQGLESLAQKAGMGLMGLGGLIAIIGGVMFLVIVLRAIYRK